MTCSFLKSFLLEFNQISPVICDKYGSYIEGLYKKHIYILIYKLILSIAISIAKRLTPNQQVNLNDEKIWNNFDDNLTVLSAGLAGCIGGDDDTGTKND